MPLTVTGFRYTVCFERDLKRAPPDIRQDAKTALERLKANPASNSLRCHPLPGYGRPLLYKIDVTTNRAWQITFEMEGTIAALRRIGTHKLLDREPRV